MMRRIFGLVVGILLFFPGPLLLRWLLVDELGIYQEMTLTDALLGIIIILAGVLIFGQPKRPLTAEEIKKEAKELELASRRLKKAQQEHAEILREKKSRRRSSSGRSTSGRSSSGRSSTSRRSPRSSNRSGSQARSRSSSRSSSRPSSRSSRSSRSERGDRRR